MDYFDCPITGIKIDISKITESTNSRLSTFYYDIEISNQSSKYIILCESFYNLLWRRREEVHDIIEEVRPYLAHEFLNTVPSSKGFITYHWDCQNSKGKERHLILKDYILELRESKKYPRNRKQKSDFILRYLYQNNYYAGKGLRVIDNISVWGNLFMKNHAECMFYLEGLEKKGLVEFKNGGTELTLTFDALDSIESQNDLVVVSEKEYFEPVYDIGLSFAGEERSYVEEVAKELKNLGIRVFYDNYETQDLWGKDLYQHLNNVYKNECKYCIIFISQNYAKKVWTRHELKAAQAKAFLESEEYILPIKFDNTELPGINPQIGYLSHDDYTPKQIAELALAKLKR